MSVQDRINALAAERDRLKAVDKYRMYSVQQIMQIVGKSNQTILTYIRTGKLKAVKIGRSWRVAEADLETFLKGKQE